MAKKTIKKTTAKNKPVAKKVIKKPSKKIESPMTFHDNPKKNIAWYAASALLVGVVVLANILPSDSLISIKGRELNEIPTKVDITGGAESIRVHEEKLAASIDSIDQLEEILQKNVNSVENVLRVIQKRELRTVEQLDGIAKTALGLDVRLSQLQAELNSLQQQKEEQAKINDPSRIFLGQMMIFLTDSYHRGNVSHKQLNNLLNFSKTVAKNEEMSMTVASLINLTPDEGPITLTELSLYAGKLMHAGAPEVKDLLEVGSDEDSYISNAKRYLSDWVEVKKLSVEGEDHPWIKSLSLVQQALSRGNIAKVQSMLDNEKSFARDTRIDKFKEKVALYVGQQTALSAVMNAYSNSYVMSVQ